MDDHGIAMDGGGPIKVPWMTMEDHWVATGDHVSDMPLQ